MTISAALHRGDDEAPEKHGDRGLVAIVGGGIVGACLAAGLQGRGVSVVVYERASNFHEIGAGIAFTGVAQKCMAQLSPDILEALMRVSNKNEHTQDNYWDGFHRGNNNNNNNNDNAVSDGPKLLFSLPNAKMEWRGCLRSAFLDELSRVLPQGVVKFDKELVSYEDKGYYGGGVSLRFTDGSIAECDVLIGCDGINSSIRQQMFSSSHPEACKAQFTSKTSYRFLLPIDLFISTLGQSKAHNHCMLTGPGAHILSYPVAQMTMSNVVVFVTDDDTATSRADREDILERFASWRPEVRSLMAHTPDTPMSWRIYDIKNPVPSYSQGNVTLAGDSAHASSPHHGAGAGFGVEDALALTSVLAEAMVEDPAHRPQALAAALEAYNLVRYDRTQWLVRSSRETGDIYEWMYPASGSDPSKIKAELAARQQKIWEFDVDEMINSVTRKYHSGLETRLS
ncbi:FAD/NAD(P)-binding domain-containing protein [Xylariaceae sp. FL0255]|nr:FAD/NAD(P)-binding domain-containing protein [Xylariaceae sp. FL0255]